MNASSVSNSKNTKVLIMGIFLVFLASTLVSIEPILVLVAITALILCAVTLLVFVKRPLKTISAMSSILLISLFLMPKTTLNGVNFRFEDLLAVFFVVFLAILTLKRVIAAESSVTKWIVVYLVYNFLITAVNMLFKDLSFIYIFYPLKEVQYFVYFFTTLIAMKYEGFERKFINIFLALSLITMAWGVYQIVFDNVVGYYGIGIISEPLPSQSGGVYFLISMFFLYLINASSVTFKKTLFFLLFLGAAGLLTATISRTGIMALILSYGVYFLFTFFRMKAVRVLIASYIMVLSLPLIYLLLSDFLLKIVDRISQLGRGTSVRTNKWDEILSQVGNVGLIFGEGRGFGQVLTGGFTLSIDSQYVRNYLELGIFGSLLFLLIIAAILLFAFKRLKTLYAEALFIILITTGFLVMSVTHEVFLVSIQASMYWILIGAFMGIILNKEKKIDDTTKEQTA